MEDIELFVNEEDLENGIEAISLVEAPAIEENFVALKKHKVEFKTIDEEKRIVIGLALVPDKKIYRKDGEREYNIYFSKDTVFKASELWMKRLKTNNVTLEHERPVDGVYWFQSWTVEDPKKDKSALYDLGAVEGSWVVMGRVVDDKVWNDVKEGKYLGLSIEGFFSEKEELSKEQILINEIKKIVG